MLRDINADRESVIAPVCVYTVALAADTGWPSATRVEADAAASAASGVRTAALAVGNGMALCSAPDELMAVIVAM
ncbi:hypothetical protein D3C72_2109710 [compost metagenome]